MWDLTTKSELFCRRLLVSPGRWPLNVCGKVSQLTDDEMHREASIDTLTTSKSTSVKSRGDFTSTQVHRCLLVKKIK
jgi:hypothetical protein